MSLNTCVHVFNANIAKYLTLDIGCLQMMRLFNGFVSGERRLDMGVTSGKYNIKRGDRVECPYSDTGLSLKNRRYP